MAIHRGFAVWPIMKKGYYSAPWLSRTWRPVRRFVDLMRSTRAEYQRDQARYFAVAMVYYAFITLEPLLFLVVTLPGLMLRSPRLAAVAERQILRVVETNF